MCVGDFLYLIVILKQIAQMSKQHLHKKDGIAPVATGKWHPLSIHFQMNFSNLIFFWGY